MKTCFFNVIVTTIERVLVFDVLLFY